MTTACKLYTIVLSFEQRRLYQETILLGIFLLAPTAILRSAKSWPNDTAVHSKLSMLDHLANLLDNPKNIGRGLDMSQKCWVIQWKYYTNIEMPLLRVRKK